jgi:hypothetical protein
VIDQFVEEENAAVYRPKGFELFNPRLTGYYQLKLIGEAPKPDRPGSELNMLTEK